MIASHAGKRLRWLRIRFKCAMPSAGLMVPVGARAASWPRGRVGDVDTLTGWAADLRVVRQRQDLVAEPGGVRRPRHGSAHHVDGVIGGSDGGAEGSHELARGRGALILVGWHGRRLLPGVP